jgi:hypothetical protein
MDQTVIAHLSGSDRAVGDDVCERPFFGQFAARLRTGCVYDAQPADTVGVLVTRADPRTRRRHPRGLTPIQAHWPLFAPSMQLLTGHETACRSRHCRGVGRCAEHRPQQHLGWPAFAAAYRAELEEWPLSTRLAVAQQVVAWLRAAPSVTILSFERSPTSALNAPDGWAQRHIFRAWLRTLLPLTLPPGVLTRRTGT